MLQYAYDIARTGGANLEPSTEIEKRISGSNAPFSDFTVLDGYRIFSL